MGRLAMIMSMPVGKFVCRSFGVMWAMSSGREVFQWAVADGLDRLAYLDLKLYLQDDLLVKVTSIGSTGGAASSEGAGWLMARR